MSGIRTHAAAALLGVSPNTLRSWERRYDFPRPHRSPGGHRQYSLGDIEGLRIALAETHNVSSAISMARERGEGPSSCSRLNAAFASFDEEKANRLLEESLAVRSVERTVEELLLSGVASLEDGPTPSAEYEFAWRHATGWMSALKRLATPAIRPDGVLVLDASAALELDALHAQALELMLRRSGLRTLSLSAGIEPLRLGRAVRALEPAALVLTGHHATLDAIGRLVFAVRSVIQDVLVLDFRAAVPDTGASTVGRLGDAPLQARDALLESLQSRGQRGFDRSPGRDVRRVGLTRSS